MYIPPFFAETDHEQQVARIRQSPLGSFVVGEGDGFRAGHIPFVYQAQDSGLGTLRAHIPKANPLSDSLRDGAACLVMFHGPEGYMSPSWYATKQEHGRVVPTWNYSIVHVHGTASIIDDPGWILEQLNLLTDQNESQRSAPWAVDDAPEAYTRGLMASLVGLQVSISRIEGKTKASQNQPAQNKASILDAMASEQPDAPLTKLMQDVLEAE